MAWFSKNVQLPIFTTICPLGAEYFRADGRRKDRQDAVNSRFSKFLGTRLKMFPRATLPAKSLYKVRPRMKPCTLQWEAAD